MGGIRLKIRTQLILSFFLIIFLTLSTFGYNFYVSQKNMELIALIQDQTNDSIHAQEMELYLSGHSDDQRGYLLTNDKKFIDESIVKLGVITKNLESITVVDLAPAVQENYKVIEEKMKQYKLLSSQFNQFASEGKLREAKSLHLNEIRSLREELIPAVATLAQTLINNNKNNEQIVVEKTNVSQKQSLYLLGGLIILSSLLVFYLVIRINRPLNKLIDVSKTIASGDFTVTLDTRRNDELGMLAKAFDEMKGNVREIISNIMDASSRVAASSQQLTASAKESTDVSQRISHAAFNLAKKGKEQKDIIGVTVMSVNQTIESLEQMKKDSSMMYTLTDETFKSTMNGEKMILKIVSETKALEEQIIQTTGITNTLADLSNKIEQIAILIQDFAEQTRLLSLNASIEAARAGESGNGFGVVAQEIKKLSDSSKQSAQKVTELVKQIQQQTTICTSSMQDSYKQVEQNLNSIAETQESFEQIKENAHSSKQTVENVTQNIASIFNYAKKLLDSTKGLETIAYQLGQLSQENSAASEEQLANLEQISAASQYLSQIADDLESETKRFKI